MITLLRARRTRLARRAVAAALGAFHLVLVVGTGDHAGDHAAAGLDRLPLEFHDHAFEWTQPGSGEFDAHAACVACHLQRTGLDLPTLASPGATAPPRAAARIVDVDRGPRGPGVRPEPIRGPPLPSMA